MTKTRPTLERVSKEMTVSLDLVQIIILTWHSVVYMRETVTETSVTQIQKVERDRVFPSCNTAKLKLRLKHVNF